MKTQHHHQVTRIFLFLLALLLASLACSFGQEKPEPASPADESPVGTTAPATPAIALEPEIRLDEQGFAFRPLPGYTLDTAFGVQMMAEGADPDTGPAFMLVGGEAPQGTTAEESIQMLASSEVMVGELQPIRVDGREGLSAELQRSTDNLSGRVVAVMVSPSQQFVIFALAPASQWEAEVSGLFEAILASVRLFEMQLEPQPAQEPLQPETPTELSEIRQWAVSATASSQYGSNNWSATQATGAPDVATCGDNGKAWAAASSSTVEWLEVSFAVPVEPIMVNVHLSYNPIYISKMELIDTNGVSHQIYKTETPGSYAECPTIFDVNVGETGIQVDRLKITIDQTNSPSWVEIDAVELVGYGDASLLADMPTIEPGQPPAAGFDLPAGFMWRLGGQKVHDTAGLFPGLWGIEYAPGQDMIYLADAVYHIHLVSPTGELIGAFKHPEMRVPQDVKVDFLGNVYVAAWGSGKVLVFPPLGEGDPYAVFGERGRGDGQFGDFSPTHLAVGLDGRIYTHDRNQNDEDQYYHRILVFSPQGEWLQTIQFEDAFFTPGGMDVGPDGNLYVVGFVGSKILKYSPEGELLATLGEEAIRSVTGGAQGIAFDEAGNIYLALWTGGMVKLDPQGNLLAQWGVQVKDGENAWPEGGFYQPSGVAVTADGAQTFFIDTSSKYAYLTAFTFTR